MSSKETIGIALAVMLSSCSRVNEQVVEKVPKVLPLSASSVANAYVVSMSLAPSFSVGDLEARRSPDRAQELEVTHDTQDDRPTGFYGLQLRHLARGTVQPIISLWEGDIGSGVDLKLKWADNSRAIVISGSTRGFTRSQEGYRVFEFLYLVDEDRFYTVSDEKG